MKTNILVYVVTVVTGLAFAVYCGVQFEDGTASVEKNELKRIGMAFHMTHSDLGRAPTNWNELVEHGYDKDLKEFQSKGYLVNWDADIQEPGTVLAIHPRSIESGGVVVLADASVVERSREEVAALIKGISVFENANLQTR